MGVKVIFVDAEELFLGNTFIDVSDEEASKIDVVEFLDQGPSTWI